MPFQKKSSDGEVFLDLRASPGIPPELAVRLGYAPEQVKEGAVFESATLGCPHCGSCVVINPLRTRERAHCYKCNAYICDGCEILSHQPNYVHSTIKELKDLVGSGKYTMVGGSTAQPVLLKTGGNDG